MAKYEFIGDQDLTIFTKNLVNGRPTNEYHISQV